MSEFFDTKKTIRQLLGQQFIESVLPENPGNILIEFDGNTSIPTIENFTNGLFSFDAFYLVKDDTKIRAQDSFQIAFYELFSNTARPEFTSISKTLKTTETFGADKMRMLLQLARMTPSVKGVYCTGQDNYFFETPLYLRDGITPNVAPVAP
ncbi:MAG: hypothetical protein WBK77_07340 [Alphaproteobacteria bacterium]